MRAATTLALGCTVVQGIVNESDGIRIRLLLWGEERQRILQELDAAKVSSATGGRTGEDSMAKEIILPPPTYSRSIDSPTPSVPSRETFSERSDRLLSTAFVSLTDSLARISPVRKMDDEDYELALIKRLKSVDEHRSKLEAEMVELKDKVIKS